MAHWWLVTWNTYGSWLPGDPRGFRTFRGQTYIPPPARYAKPGEPTYQPEDYADLHQAAAAGTGETISLSADDRRTALDTLATAINTSNIIPAIASMAEHHCHLLAKFGASHIRPTVGEYKAAITRQLHELGDTRDRLWAKECHMSSKKTEKEFRDAFAYVQRHIREGAEVYVWPSFSK